MKERSLLRVFLPLILLVLTLLVCSPAFASAGFSDVPDDHWAVKYIDKMSAVGVIGGYDDGTFRPDDNVSHLEAVVMAVRCTGNSGSASVDVPFSVPWGEQDVARALQTGLIKTSEDFVHDKDASRAWVTRLLVRMASMDAEARRVSVEPNFADSYKIPEWASGYVKVAQENNLVGGYNDDTFRPLKGVTRKEMAVLLDRALDYVENKPGNKVDGTVMEASSMRVSVSTSDGNYLVNSDVPAYDKNGRISITDLQRLDRVSMIIKEDNVQYLEKLESEPVSSVINGKVKKVYAEQGTLVVETSSGNLRTLYLPDSASISVSGSDMQGLSALQQGDEVQVTLSSTNIISNIIVKSKTMTRENEGVVYELLPEEDLITIQAENSKLLSYLLGDQVNVLVENQRFPNLEDIYPGDKVRLGIKDKAVEEIEVLEVYSKLELTGRVVSNSPEDRVITLETGEGPKAFKVASSANIIIGNRSEPALGDVIAGDQAKVKVDSGKITTLEVEGNKSENNFTAEVKAVDTGNDILTLQNSDDELQLYDIKDDARILIDGEEAKLHDIEKDMEVNVRLVEEEVVYLEADNSTSGEVEEIDEESLLLVLKDDNGSTESYLLDDNVDVDSEDSRNDLDDINRGDYAEITLEDDIVTDIDLRTIFIMQVDDVKEELDRLYVEDEDGDRERLRMNSSVELEVPGIDYPDLDDVEEEDMVRVIYMGYDLEKVVVVQPKRGEVTSVNRSSETIAIDCYSGENAVLDFNSDCNIIIDEEDYDSLSRISPGDRVEVMENTEGGYDFKVMEEMSGILAYPPSDDEIYLKDGYNGWADYDLYKNVYVQYSSGSVSLGDLNKGDSVRMYMLNDKVFIIKLR
ncbi:MAG: S-layer homology domain-containing protein [Clostridiales bacterium]|nr:S-layer homology domain-containing protein [Clostridiales bacterium]